MLNLVGYRVWYYFELKTSDHNIESMLDKKTYLEEDLITIRIPLSLPYQTDTDDFERISGEVSFAGKIYKYVERKMEDGFFVLKCLPDHGKMQLEREKNEIVKNNLDQSQNTSDKPAPGNTLLKYVFSEFEQNIFTVNINSSFTSFNNYVTYNDRSFFSLHVAAPAQPPDLIS